MQNKTGLCRFLLPSPLKILICVLQNTLRETDLDDSSVDEKIKVCA